MQLAFGGDHPVYITQCPGHLPASPTGSGSFDETAEVHLDREIDGNRVPCLDLLEDQGTEVVADLLHVRLVNERPWYGFPLIPCIREGAGSGADEGVQVVDHAYYLGF